MHIILFQSVFQQPSVQNLIEKADEKNEKLFDAVVVCCALFGEEPGYYLAHRVSQKLNCFDKIIVRLIFESILLNFISYSFQLNSSLVLAHSKAYANAWENWSTGNPFHPAYMPIFSLPFTQKMGFFKRVVNTLATVMSVAFRDW